MPAIPRGVAEPMTPGPAARLAAVDFSSYVSRLTQNFSGREWLFKEINQWLAEGEEQFFVLIGPPGIGKSAVAAHLTQVRNDIVAYHFCMVGRGDTVTPSTVLRSIAAQLGEKLPGYGEALANTINPIHLSVQVSINVETMNGGQITGVIIQNLALSNPEDELQALLIAPLAALRPPRRPQLLVIDSLDEAVTYGGKPSLVELLAKMGNLPPWLRVLCTTRDERRVLRFFTGLQPRYLSAESEKNREDVRRYALHRLGGRLMRSTLSQAGIESGDLLDRLLALPLDNFLHARVLLDDLEAGRQPLDDLSALPPSIDAIYHRFLERFSFDDWTARFQPILVVLAVAGEPLTEAQIANFTSLSRSQLRQDLNVVRQFLDATFGQWYDEHGQREAFQLFHFTLREYLIDEVRNQDFWCPPEDGHRLIADYYVRNMRANPEASDAYGVRNLSSHLIELKDWPSLAELVLENVSFLRATSKRLGARVNFWGGSEIEKFLQSCLEAMPDPIKARSAKLANIRTPAPQASWGGRDNWHQNNIFSFSSSLNLFFFIEGRDLTSRAGVCNFCGGTIHAGWWDAGGADYFEHYYVWCQQCFRSSFEYSHSDDYNYQEMHFDSDSNTWLTGPLLPWASSPRRRRAGTCKSTVCLSRARGLAAAIHRLRCAARATCFSATKVVYPRRSSSAAKPAA
jgi:hypothetical protein